MFDSNLICSLDSLGLIASALAGFGIIFEQPHRRVEFTYYCLPKAVEGMWNFMERRKYVKEIPH